MRFEDVVAALVKAVPDLGPQIAELHDSWEGDPPSTIVMATIGEAYVERYEHLDNSQKNAFFATVEAGLAGQEQSMIDAVATGLLEAVISEIERGGLDRVEIFDTQAGPLARRYVRAWDELCGL